MDLYIRIFNFHDLLELSFLAWKIDDYYLVYLYYPTNYSMK